MATGGGRQAAGGARRRRPLLLVGGLVVAIVVGQQADCAMAATVGLGGGLADGRRQCGFLPARLMGTYTLLALGGWAVGEPGMELVDPKPYLCMCIHTHNTSIYPGDGSSPSQLLHSRGEAAAGRGRSRGQVGNSLVDVISIYTEHESTASLRINTIGSAHCLCVRGTHHQQYTHTHSTLSPKQSTKTQTQVVALAKATPKIIYYRDETAQKLIKGINAVADVVKVRLS